MLKKEPGGARVEYTIHHGRLLFRKKSSRRQRQGQSVEIVRIDVVGIGQVKTHTIATMMPNPTTDMMRLMFRHHLAFSYLA